ncbi:MAG TPA: hypothetical protein VGB83_03375 [Actinomycetota bacterium]
MNFTIDPLSPALLIVSEAIYLGIAGAMLVGSMKIKNEWVKASVAGLGISIIGWHLLAILPSWWLYFAEGELGMGGQGCVKLDLSCLKQTVKDSVVVVENAVVLGLFVVAFVIYQKKNPRQLASGETKPEATGGYK